MKDPLKVLPPIEQAVFEKIYPVIDQVTEEFGEHVDLFLLVNLARRLVSLGEKPEDIAEQVLKHAQSQYKWNQRRKH